MILPDTIPELTDQIEILMSLGKGEDLNKGMLMYKEIIEKLEADDSIIRD